MKKLILSLIFITLFSASFAQSVLIFQPSSGNNDGTDEGGINGGKDAMTYDATPYDNYGAHVNVATSPVSNCNQTNLMAFIKFDVFELPENVDSVFVCFMTDSSMSYCYSNCDNNFDFRYINEDWNEMTLNWDNKPELGEPFINPINIKHFYPGGLIRVNITDVYNEWRSESEPNHGFAVYPLDGDCNNASVTFSFPSSDFTEDTTRRPYLQLYFQSESAANIHGSLTQVSTYPNPAKGMLHIQFLTQLTGLYQVRVYDVLGSIRENKTLSADALRSQIFSLSLNNYVDGTYFYVIEGEGSRASGHFVVSR